MTIKFIVKSNKKCSYCEKSLYGKMRIDYCSHGPKLCCFDCKKNYGKLDGKCKCGEITSRWKRFNMKEKKNEWQCYICYKISIGNIGLRKCNNGQSKLV